MVLATEIKSAAQSSINEDYIVNEIDYKIERDSVDNTSKFEKEEKNDEKFEIDDLVEITSNFEQAKNLQNGHGEWVKTNVLFIIYSDKKNFTVQMLYFYLIKIEFATFTLATKKKL